MQDLQPRRGRLVCMLLSPDRPTRRRACVSRRGGRLRATLVRVDETGAAAGVTRPLHGARTVVRGGFMTLRAPAGTLRVRLGDLVSWRTYVQWRDGSDEAWVSAYARRVEAMMRSYLRGGRSYVYWLTLPTPRRASFVRIYSRVNVAIKRAAERVGGGVLDLARVFTPGGQFRQTITFRGTTIDARQPDGIHLSTAGAAVAATLIVDQLRADHALP